MKALMVAIAATTMLAGAARAQEKPLIAPPPAWVKPAPHAALPTKADDAPVQVLLLDQQINLERGRKTTYSETIFRIQTPQGLSAGNISIPWRPDADVLTVHRLVIRRGDRTIDVLAAGQTFTVVRREQNLESATLDGVLTANIQPEGLQVGDTVEFAASVASTDPTLKTHVEHLTGWNGFQAARAHLRAQWPAGLDIRFRRSGSLPAFVPTTAGGVSAIEFSLDGLKPEASPKLAPARYRIGRVVELTDFASWADLGRIMAPLYANASVLPKDGTLGAEVARIAALSPDARVRAEAALALVQDRIRYVALAMGAGGYLPADAGTTWARRFGDCKGKTALLLGLLHALGVRADPVAVSSTAGDGVDGRLPMVGLFDHVLVRAEIGGRTYWLDGTRTGDTSLERLTVPDVGWGLPLIAENASLVRMTPAPLAAPAQDVSIHIDATKGVAVPAPATVETILRGDEARGINLAIAGLDGETRDRMLREYWKQQYDFIDPTSVAASFDAVKGEQRLTMSGTAKLDWANGNYQTDGTAVGYRADFTRPPGPDREAPFAVPFPYYTRTRETILLPRGLGDFRLGDGMEVDQVAGGIAYRRHATIADGVFTIEKTERGVAPEFPAKDAAKEQAALRMLADRSASIRMPSGYRYTGSDMSAVMADVPTTSAGYVNRARILVNNGKRKEALADYDRAVELDPANVYAWSNRALTRIQLGDVAGARTDLDRAEKIDPDFVQNHVGRGMIADVEKRPRDAVTAYTRALAQEPRNTYALRQRGSNRAVLGDTDGVLADLAALIAIDPSNAGDYVVRGDFYLDRERFDDAIADFDRALSLDPKNVWALADRGLARVWKDDKAAAVDLAAAEAIDPGNAVVWRARGVLAQRDGKPADAIAAYTKSLARDPGSGFALGHRAEAYRAAGDREAALRDAASALAKDPSFINMYLLRANILRQLGRSEDAGREADALAAAGDVPGVDANYADVAAANVYFALNRRADAIRAYDRAIARKPEAYIYLNRAGYRARADVPGALADVEAALKLDPTLTEAIASKAELQARGGDLPAAIATYSAGLAKTPDAIGLLTGRGVAYARSGQAALAERDLARVRAEARTANALNNLCWAKATAGVLLESALADCDAALAREPAAPAYLDSRGLVLLRLGRLDTALDDYNQALKTAPDQATSLFGRSVIWARKGDGARAAADAAAAAKVDPNVGTTFARYGIAP